MGLCRPGQLPTGAPRFLPISGESTIGPQRHAQQRSSLNIAALSVSLPLSGREHPRASWRGVGAESRQRLRRRSAASSLSCSCDGSSGPVRRRPSRLRTERRSRACWRPWARSRRADILIVRGRSGGCRRNRQDMERRGRACRRPRARSRPYWLISTTRLWRADSEAPAGVSSRPGAGKRAWSGYCG